MKRQKLLVIGAGLLQYPVIEKANECGIYTIAVDNNPQAVGLKIASKGVVCDITDKDKMLAIAKENQITGVIHPCSEVAMNVMGYINDKLGLSGLGEKVAFTATNKAAMRAAFYAGGAPSPSSLCCTNLEECYAHFLKMQSDAILKPSRNSGSRGITKIVRGTDSTTFEKAFYRALENSRDHSVLIEQFINGQEYSVEAIIFQGNIHIIAITRKTTTEDPYFVELGHQQPGADNEYTYRLLSDAAIKGINALALNNCAAHAEIKVEKGAAYIMEIGGRLGGDFITTKLTPLSTGIDMVKASIYVALGQTPDLSPSHSPQAAAIRYITPAPGILKQWNWSNDAALDGVVEREFYPNIGDTIMIIKSSSDRSGHVIAVADTPKKAFDIAGKEIANLRIELL